MDGPFDKRYCTECSHFHNFDEDCYKKGGPEQQPDGSVHFEEAPDNPVCKSEPDTHLINGDEPCPICERRRMKQRELMRKRRAK